MTTSVKQLDKPGFAFWRRVCYNMQNEKQEGIK